MSKRYTASAYMEWAKLNSGATYNLATSGMRSCPLAELGVRLEELEVNGPTVYGYGPLQEALAAKSGVKPGQVVASAGASLANHLAIAASIEPGDEVLIEEPTYSLLVETDAPWLAPAPHRGKRNEPGWVLQTALVLGGLHGIEAEEIAQETTKNFIRLFDLRPDVGNW